MEPIHVPFFSSDECKECIDYINKKEKYLKKLSIKHEETYGKNRITTNLYNHYNFFIDNKKYIIRLEEKINSIFKSCNDYPMFVQSWVNIYKKNEEISWHWHTCGDSFKEYSGYTANIFLGGDENIGLTYAIHDKNFPRYHYRNIKNKLGYMLIIPNNIWHMVKNTSPNIRYTIGMTITKYYPEILRDYYCNDANNDLLAINKNNYSVNNKIIKYN